MEETEREQFKRTIRAKSGPAAVHRRKKLFYAKDVGYQTVVFRRRKYQLTPQAGAILKILYEAKGDSVSTPTIKEKLNCGDVFDSFRSQDGPKVWKILIQVVRGRKGFYKLHPDAFRY